MTGEEKAAIEEWLTLAVVSAGRAEGFASYGFQCPKCGEDFDVINGLNMGENAAPVFLMTSNVISLLIGVVTQHVFMAHGLDLAMQARTGKASKN